MANGFLRSRCALALAGVLLLGAGAGSGWSQPHKGERASQVLDALSRLSPAQRSEYLQGQRAIEQARNSQRLAQLDQVQGCLSKASAAPAVKACWQSFLGSAQKQREEQMQSQRALSQRLGLPVPPAGKPGR